MAASQAAFGTSARERKPTPWRFRDVKWKSVAARLDYANFCLSACLIVAVVVVTVTATPRLEPYYVWDARIANPIHSELDTIPSWAAVFAPLMMFAVTIGMAEFVASRRMHASATDAVSTAVYFFCDGIQAFIMGIFLTQVFKVIVGRLRPNFLARCQPQIPEGTVFTVANLTASTHSQPAYQFPCSDTGMVEEGRLAFPSGHTSAAFNLAVYASGYLIWVWHWRHPLPPRRLSWGEEFRADMLNVLAKTWMLAMICFAWGIGISRIIDYQHDVSDVLGGAFLGTMIALVYLLRAIPRWRRVLSEDDNLAPEPVGSADSEVPLAAARRQVTSSRIGSDMV